MRDDAEKPMPRPEPLSYDDTQRLMRWAGVELEPAGGVLLVAGTLRNVNRYAAEWGAPLIARLMATGALTPGGDPLEALEDLLRWSD